MAPGEETASYFALQNYLGDIQYHSVVASYIDMSCSSLEHYWGGGGGGCGQAF
jgi:hypothetical protein